MSAFAEPCAPPATTSNAPADSASPRGIAFDIDSHPHAPIGVLIPGYSVPGSSIKPVRDPSLSLIALSGVEPETPVMVAVPLVRNNSSFATAQSLAGWRVGFADRYVRGGDHEPIEHSAAFLCALHTLRQAGVQLVPVAAQRMDDTARFCAHTRNEIDDLTLAYRLDALVSDGSSTAFHGACGSGYPRLEAPLEGGGTLYFYGSRRARDSLMALVQGYKNRVACLAAGRAETTAGVE
ncbi:hypothetical protein [Pseudomonas palleroniana]|uniref:hypothetical protein n=1 Tax=Pseudomonas palleroniana TaxID=191390 RepID=UPI001E32919F|nr:hypothetical protein [Pseudomonas palleroniana]